jgi:hypothetical protein
MHDLLPSSNAYIVSPHSHVATFSSRYGTAHVCARQPRPGPRTDGLVVGRVLHEDHTKSTFLSKEK